MERKKQDFRHELKYVISSGQVLMLKNKMEHLLSLDAYVDTQGVYNIRSLYFDDLYNRCYYENENGTDPREKFRIRIYNHSTDRIRLECKRKERGMTQKTSCPLTLEQTKMLMRGAPLPDLANQPPLLRKLTLQMLMHGLRPVVIVEYDRIPYVYPNGNVRITLDTNMASSSVVSSFLDEKISKRPIMPVGQQLLEVKYDAYLPDFIYQSLQIADLQKTAFSKYYFSRRYTK